MASWPIKSAIVGLMRRIWDERGLQQGFTLNFQQSSNKCLVVEKMLVFQFSDPCHICSLTYMLGICPDIWKCIRLCPCNCPSTSVHLIFMRDCNTCFACGVTNQILPSTNSKLKNSYGPATSWHWNLKFCVSSSLAQEYVWERLELLHRSSDRSLVLVCKIQQSCVSFQLAEEMESCWST